MFSWLKRKTAEVQQARQEVVTLAADETAKFMLAVQAALGDLPRRMSDDPFVIGAIAMYAAISIKVITKGQATNALIESAMIASIERTFLGKGVAHHDAIGALMQFKNNPEYARAVQVVSLILGARYERKDLVHDPLIVEARTYVTAMPQAFRKEFGATEAEQVAYELTRRHFVEPLKAKYGQLWRNVGEA